MPKESSPRSCPATHLASFLAARLPATPHPQVDDLPKFDYSNWVWLATLAGAIYKKMPLQARARACAGPGGAGPASQARCERAAASKQRARAGGSRRGGSTPAASQPKRTPSPPTHTLNARPTCTHPCLQWLVSAFFVSSGWRLAQGLLHERREVRVQDACFAGLAAWALYVGAEVPMALAIMAGQLAAAVIS